MVFAEAFGVIAVAVIISLVDIPKFETLENPKRYKAVYYIVLVLFTLVSLGQILLKSS